MLYYVVCCCLDRAVTLANTASVIDLAQLFVSEIQTGEFIIISYNAGERNLSDKGRLVSRDEFAHALHQEFLSSEGLACQTDDNMDVSYLYHSLT